MAFILFIWGEPFFQTTFYMEAERRNREKEGYLGGGEVRGSPSSRRQVFVPSSNPGMSKPGTERPPPPTYCGDRGLGKDRALHCVSLVGLGQEPRLLASLH